ncbi:lipoate--protein ligase [Bizionia sediminis]|uniref:lipoate--protein ligase n=1 Tax=Bizionia sediminis TaxID=1737064 RepID=A0ABW5KUP2_9FLAO
MIFIDNEGHTNPKLNLALEEYALRHFDASTNYLLFYINEPSVIIGRNQNTIEEINPNYISAQNIHVVRRISGGGAVYHDLGNLNFSFITDHDGQQISNFEKFTAPVISVLNNMGVPAALKGRNDILVTNQKISGTAQFSTGKRMISHGTLLFNTNMDEVAKALHVKLDKIASKGHKSVRSRVANITDFLSKPLSMAAFKNNLLAGLYQASEPFETYKLTETEWQAVRDLKAEKYDLWEWNYGRSPKFNIQRQKRFAIGEIDMRVFVEKGRISDIKIFGDFFGRQPISDLEALLIGVPYQKTAIENQLNNLNLTGYFGTLPKTEFINLLAGTD